MKRLFFPLLIVFGLFLTGCEHFTNKGKSSKAEEKGRSNIEIINKAISTNSEAKLEAIASYAYGIDYDLKLIPDPPEEVEIAINLNNRVMSLSGTPALDKMKEMKEMIDQLTSDVAQAKWEGQKKLEEKDQEIINLQTKSKQLENAKDAEISKYMKIAQDAAAQADGTKVALDELKDQMNSWGGLGAIFYGSKRLLIRFAWGVGIFSVILIIVRIAAATKPIAASIYSVFNIAGSWAVNMLKMIFPKAVEIAGHVTSSTFNQYKSCMTKIIDSIQVVKDRGNKAGAEPSLKEVLEEVSKSMDISEKALVDQIKRELNWK